MYVPEKKSSGRLSHGKKNPLKHAEWDGFCPLAGASNRQAMDASQSPQESGALRRDFQDVQHAWQRPRRPPGSIWFTSGKGGKGPQDSMLEHAEHHNHFFMVAFDWIPIGTDIKKMYASYSTCEKFIQDTLLRVNPQHRHFYELILPGKRCKPFMDVEWNGPQDIQGNVIHNLVGKLKAYFKVRAVNQEFFEEAM
jgi:hypothetical protein